MDLFSMNREENLKKHAPLADRMRPKSLDDFFGQDHILSKGMYLERLIRSGNVPSLIFYGPPGTGKTSLAYIISQESHMEFEKLSAVSAGKKDIEKVIGVAKDNLGIYNKRTILFIDEIHSFNKTQQDALLPHVESGLITLIGATTENPYVSVNKALLSRCQLVKLEALKKEDIKNLLKKALEKDPVLKETGKKVDEEGLSYLAMAARGDARIALNTLELAVLSSEDELVTKEDIRESSLIKQASYDKSGDDHYNTISAFIKSIRGSDPDASLYYLARMIVAGEDPVFIARRLIISASEDIGLADPNAMNVANACMNAIKNIGMPEGRIPLAEATLYMALAPKSNSSYKAIDRAISYVKNEDQSSVPLHLRDSHFSGAKELGHVGYKNPHNFGGYLDQAYLPEEILDIEFYEPVENGLEKNLIENYKKTTKK